MNTYDLTRTEVSLISDALNLFESSLIERFHAAQGPAEKKSLEQMMQDVGLLGLYFAHERAQS